MQKTFSLFLNGIRQNMEKKGATIEEINKFLQKIEEKYKDSPIFDKIDISEFYEEEIVKQEDNNLDIVDQMNSISLAEFEEKDRANRILEMQIIYKDKNIFPPEEIENDGEIDNRGMFGRTQLHEAVINRNKNKVLELLEGGANVSIQDNNGLTPYQTAVLEDYQEIIELLKKKEIKN